MTCYILHYATIDADGHLFIDCLGPFNTLEEAQERQANIIGDYLNAHRDISGEQMEEQCGLFHRIAYKGRLTELQIHIEEMRWG